MSDENYKFDVFISYSHLDEAWVVNTLLPKLEKAKLKVCIDFRDFEAGIPSITNMENAVEKSRHTIAVITPNWVASEWTSFEILLTETSDPAGHRKKLIPLMLADCKLPKRISMLTWVDFRMKERENIAWTQLFSALDRFSVETSRDGVISHIQESGKTMDDAQYKKNRQIYLKWLYEECVKLPLGVLDPSQNDPTNYQPDIKLDCIYTELNTTTDIQDDATTVGRFSARDGAVISDYKQRSVLNAAIQYPHLVILGDPGSGKSTFLSYLAMCLCGIHIFPDRTKWVERLLNWPDENILPVYIKIREFLSLVAMSQSENGPLVFFEYVKSYFQKKGLDNIQQVIIDSMFKEKCVFLFDGLDEISDSSQLGTMHDLITSFFTVFQGNRFILTCRTFTYSNLPWQLGVPVVKLAPFNQEQIYGFIQTWYDNLVTLKRITSRMARAKIEELKDAIEDFYELAKNPLLLTVMVLLHGYVGSLPKERARLYSQCVDLMLWKWQQYKTVSKEHVEQGILEQLGIRENDIRRALWEVAYHVHSQQEKDNNFSDIKQGDLMEVLQRYMDGNWQNAQIFLDYIEKRAGLLLENGFDEYDRRVYTFLHRTFQEFLSGCYLASKRDFSRQVLKLIDAGEHWREVLLLAIGHLVFNQNDIIKALDTANLIYPSDNWKAIWFAGEILSMVGLSAANQDDVGKKIIQPLRRDLCSLTTKNDIQYQDRMEIGKLLGVLGDEREGVSSLEPKQKIIKGGYFFMGTDIADVTQLIETTEWAQKWHESGLFEYEIPKHELLLADYNISIYPITNIQYSFFIEEKGYSKREFWTQEGWVWREARSVDSPLYFSERQKNYPNHPVVWVSWFEAIAYCHWLSKVTGRNYNLPDEAQWERAAAGEKKNMFPWGNTWSAGIANTAEINVGNTTSVGIFPNDVSSEGCFDMGGNVGEWCLSKFSSYPYIKDDGRNDLSGSDGRVLRGGSFGRFYSSSRCACRFWDDPNYRGNHYGFRVVSNP